MEFLAKVDPDRIVIDPHYVQPSEWDLVAVLEDLREFVTVSRIIKATPVLKVVDGVLRLVSGEPFVRAAQEADPPLPEIVCLVKTDQANLDVSSLLVPVSPTALMEEFSELDSYEAFEILSFISAVTNKDKARIEEEIRGFFAKVHEHPTVYGGSYGWISDFTWNDIEHRVSWVWERNDHPGRHQQFLLDTLRHINTKIARLRSWNGLALQLFK